MVFSHQQNHTDLPETDATIDTFVQSHVLCNKCPEFDANLLMASRLEKVQIQRLASPTGWLNDTLVKCNNDIV